MLGVDAMGMSRGDAIAAVVAMKPEPLIVEMGEVKTILVTGVLPLEVSSEFTRLTGLEDHPWGGPHGPERQVVVRLALTPNAIADLVRVFAGMVVTKRVGGH
jgi:hypothetical protein